MPHFERFDFLPLLRAIVLLLLLSGATQKINADNSLAVNRSAPACKLPPMPLLCDNKQLRYAYNAATGNCVSLYTSGCSANTMTKHFLTFEECRRDNMPIMRY
uniref:Spleen trypsin inhibitor I n=1 Tax=Zeugodacus cucurbitae TaxID=28588 RepID=A0A0A1WRN4_ZEUCU